MSAEKWAQIERLNLEHVKQKWLGRKSLWRRLWCNVDCVEKEYKQFLYLIATNPGEVVVPWSEDLDDLWHEHILDTQKYAEDCQAIFGRFNRGSMRQPADLPKGTGLGLALVDGHVRMHGGEVVVDDAPTGGARFVVRFPRIA